MSDTILTQNATFLEELAHAAFKYFLENSSPATGLIADSSRPGSPSSIAATGLGLTSYLVAVERGWLSRQEALERTLKIIDFFSNSESGSGQNVTGYKGFYYHFLDMKTGRRVWDSELSMVDTALLVAGMLAAAAYFSGNDPSEFRLRELVDVLYRRIDWQWAKNNGTTLCQGWKPSCGFLHYDWEGYNEGTILYILALASPTYPLNPEGYEKWSMTYQWENIYGHNILYAGPLFIHQFSHIWIDFRGIRDAFMREKNSDYFQNSQNAVLIQREYARLNPLRFQGYDENCWGLSASEGPEGKTVQIHQRERPCFAYAARGVPFGPDDGTLSPAAVVACLPFAPKMTISALKHIIETYPSVIQDNRIPSGFNPSVKSDNHQPWRSEGYLGLDQGLVVLMIENAKSNFIWNLMQKCRYLSTGLKRAGYKGGWLS